MLTPTPAPPSVPTLQQLSIIRFALLGALVVYCIVGAAIAIPPREINVLLTGVMGFYAAAALAAGFFLRSWAFAPRNLFARSAGGGEATRDALVSRAMAKVMTFSIISWALAESAGVMGMVLTLIHGVPWLVAAFSVPAAACLLVWGPPVGGRQDLEAMLDEAVRRGDVHHPTN